MSTKYSIYISLLSAVAYINNKRQRLSGFRYAPDFPTDQLTPSYRLFGRWEFVFVLSELKTILYLGNLCASSELFK
jgi:hypothetical protein